MRHLSTEKRARQALRQRARNRALTLDYRYRLKRLRSAPARERDARLKELQSALDVAAGKGPLHANTAARRLSRAARWVRESQARESKAAAAPKKRAARGTKKPAAKKRKTAAKKARPKTTAKK